MKAHPATARNLSRRAFLRATGALGLGCLADPLAAARARADDGCAADG